MGDLPVISILIRALQNNSRVKTNYLRVKANYSWVLVDMCREIFDYSRARLKLESNGTIVKFAEWLCKVYSLGTAKRYNVSLSMLSLSDSEITILKVYRMVPIQSFLLMAPNYCPFLLPGMRQYRVPLGAACYFNKSSIIPIYVALLFSPKHYGLTQSAC